MIDKFILIIKSKLSNKKNLGDWYKKRLEICHTCPYNSKNIYFSSYNLRTWKWYFLNIFKPFCSVCGCQITAKASIKIEDCGLIDIDKEPKWTSIL